MINNLVILLVIIGSILMLLGIVSFIYGVFTKNPDESFTIFSVAVVLVALGGLLIGLGGALKTPSSQNGGGVLTL